jgi:Holliday junction resolvasome RuvABC endonuclease subunit
MIYIALDPSLNTTGFAVLDSERKDAERLLFAGQFTSRGESDEERLESIYTGLRDNILSRIPFIDDAVVYIERPTGFSFARSRGFAGKQLNQVALQKNCLAVGVIFALFRGQGCDVRFISPAQWKGRASKVQTSLIAEKIFNIHVGEHARDSIALGWYILNRDAVANA